MAMTDGEIPAGKRQELRALVDKWRVPSPTVDSEEIRIRNEHARELEQVISGDGDGDD